MIGAYITTNDLLNVFEFDSITCEKHLSKKKPLNLPRNTHGQQFGKPEVIMLPGKLLQFYSFGENNQCKIIEVI